MACETFFFTDVHNYIFTFKGLLNQCNPLFIPNLSVRLQPLQIIASGIVIPDKSPTAQRHIKYEKGRSVYEFKFIDSGFKSAGKCNLLYCTFIKNKKQRFG